MRKPASAFFIFTSLAIVALFEACSNPLLQEHSVPAKLTMEVKDPLFRKLTDITEEFRVTGTGEFRAGSATVNGIVFDVPKGTKFTCDLILPIKDPEHIDASSATGSGYRDGFHRRCIAVRVYSPVQFPGTESHLQGNPSKNC